MKVILLIILFSSFFATSHDLAIGIFHIYEEENNLILDITLDSADLSSELGKKEYNLEKLQEYLDNQIDINIEQTAAVYKANDFMFIEDHIKIHGTLSGYKSNYKKISISNTVLSTVSDQSNIIQVDLNGSSRDFRMHYGRKHIEILY